MITAHFEVAGVTLNEIEHAAIDKLRKLTPGAGSPRWVYTLNIRETLVDNHGHVHLWTADVTATATTDYSIPPGALE